MRNIQKLLPPTYFFICLVAVIVLHLAFPISKVIYPPHNYFGIVLIILGIILSVWADNIFKREKTTVKPFKKSAVLITGGLYCFSRHPMYLGFVFILLGLAIFLGSLTTFLGPVVMFIILEKLFILREEESLEKTFGKRYREYKSRVRRWL